MWRHISVCVCSLAVGTVGTVAAFSAAKEVPQAISVGIHYRGTCLGKCPCFDATVGDDGHVSVRSCQPFDVPSGNTSFVVSRAEVAKFERILRPLRSGPNLRGNCAVRPKPLNDQIAEWVVSWTSPKPAFVRACWDDGVSSVIDRALRAIGASTYSGRQLSSEQRKAAPRTLREMNRAR
jgi:predicted ribosomally synthesized peptide with SipW-like signal peptide